MIWSLTTKWTKSCRRWNAQRYDNPSRKHAGKEKRKKMKAAWNDTEIDCYIVDESLRLSNDKWKSPRRVVNVVSSIECCVCCNETFWKFRKAARHYSKIRRKINALGRAVFAVLNVFSIFSVTDLHVYIRFQICFEFVTNVIVTQLVTTPPMKISKYCRVTYTTMTRVYIYQKAC